MHAADDGLRLVMPGWLPWTDGKATVSFEGIEVLVGDVRIEGNVAHFRAERALPLHPLMTDPSQILRPNEETKKALMGRIEPELARRGQPLPKMPDDPPEPTPGAKIRAAAAQSFAGFASGEG